MTIRTTDMIKGAQVAPTPPPMITFLLLVAPDVCVNVCVAGAFVGLEDGIEDGELSTTVGATLAVASVNPLLCRAVVKEPSLIAMFNIVVSGANVILGAVTVYTTDTPPVSHNSLRTSLCLLEAVMLLI